MSWENTIKSDTELQTAIRMIKASLAIVEYDWKLSTQTVRGRSGNVQQRKDIKPGVVINLEKALAILEKI